MKKLNKFLDNMHQRHGLSYIIIPEYHESGSYETVSLLTGPEGGLEPSEVEQASAAGLHVCTLGRRILRCETAPLCGLSAVMYASGEF